MNYLYRLVLAVASAAFFVASAQAQNAGTVSNHAVPIGKGPGVSGYTSVAPGPTGIPLTSNGAGVDPSFHAVTNAGIAPGAANTVKGSVNGTTTSDLAIASCSLAYQFTQWVTGTGWQCGLNPVLPSRAIAATLDLSAFSVVTTQGYATAGDGGGAVFKKLSSGGFIDSFITTFSTTGGTGYNSGGTGGPFYGVLFTNSGKPFAIGTVNTTSGVISSVNIAGTPSNKCVVGDVFAVSGSAAATSSPANGLPAGGSGASITVTGCSSPLGSFTDSAGNKLQIVQDGLGPRATQFGAVGDWDGTDGTATDNFNSIQACSWYSTFKSSTSYDSGGYWGGRCQFPPGSYMVCAGGTKPLIVAQGVEFWGASGVGSTIKFCSAWTAGATQLELGDPNWHFACFQSALWHMNLRSDSGTEYIVHSNCGQDYSGLYQTYIYSNGGSGRGCVHYEKGYGGASKFTLWNVSCSANSNSPQIWIGNTDASGLNLGTTMVELTGIVLGSASSGTPVQTAAGVKVNGGWITGTMIHCESMTQCVQGDISATANGFLKLSNVNAGNGNPNITCTGVIQFTGTNATTGNNALDEIQAPGSCTHTVDNGMGGGASYNNSITIPACFNPSLSRTTCP